MYCNAGRCICMSTYVQKDNFCYESKSRTFLLSYLRAVDNTDKNIFYIEINPGQSGCIYNEQCSGVWARTTCVNGICACPTVAAVVAPLQPIQTKDGVVCGADSKFVKRPKPMHPTLPFKATVLCQSMMA